MLNETISKSVYAVLAELLYFLEIKKKYRKICVLVAAYIDAHPAKDCGYNNSRLILSIVFIYIFLHLLHVQHSNFNCRLSRLYIPDHSQCN